MRYAPRLDPPDMRNFTTQWTRLSRPAETNALFASSELRSGTQGRVSEVYVPAPPRRRPGDSRTEPGADPTRKAWQLARYLRAERPDYAYYGRGR